MIERIEALIEKATPGPWRTSRALLRAIVSEPTDSIVAKIAAWNHETDAADAAFIAHSRQLLPLMLAEIKAWRAAFGSPGERHGAVRKTGLDLDAYCAENLPTDQPIDDAGEPIDGEQNGAKPR